MNPSYENRRRYEDGSVLCRIHPTRDAAIDDVAQMIEDGDEPEYDATMIVHRNRLGLVECAEVTDLRGAAEEWLRERTDPPIRSLHHMASFGRAAE